MPADMFSGRKNKRFHY